MNCRGCGNQEAYHVRTTIEDGEIYDICNVCSNLSMSDAGVPDVYLTHSGQTFGSLCDNMGKPIPIQSKRHKKEVMDAMGVSECGDRINGAPFGTKTWVDGTRDYRRKQFAKDKPMIRENYQRYLENARKKR